MAQHTTRRHEIIAGTFVLAMMVAAAFALVVVSKTESWFAPGRTVDVGFPLDSGIRGMSVGSPVQIGGYPIGTVQRIRTDLKGAGTPPIPSVVLTLKLPADLILKTDADIVITGSMLGGGGVVNIRSLGAGPDPAAGEYIRGTPTVGAFVEDTVSGLGIGAVQKGQLRDMISDLSKVAGEFRKQISPGGDAAAAISSVRKMAGPDGDLAIALTNARGISESLKGRGDEIAADVRKTLARLDRGAEQLAAMIAKADAGLDPVLAKAKSIADKVDAVLIENREDIRAIFKTSRNAVETADRGLTRTFADAADIAATVKKSLASFQVTLGNLEKVSGAAREVAVLNKDNIDDALRSFKEAGNNLKLATREIRRAPWRLLHNPDDQERDSLNLLDSARLFNDGAGRMEESVKRLSALAAAAADGKIAGDDPKFRQMVEELRARLKALEKAEKALFDGIK